MSLAPSDFCNDGVNELSGLTYLDPVKGQSSGKLYWSIWSAYHVRDLNLNSQGFSDTAFASPNAQGVWKLQGYTSRRYSGYLFEIPKPWADQYNGGKYLAVANKPLVHVLQFQNDSSTPSPPQGLRIED